MSSEPLIKKTKEHAIILPQTLEFTKIDEIPGIVAKLRNTFKSGQTKPLEWRKAQLRALGRMLTENKSLFEEALWKDLKKNAPTANMTEIMGTLEEIKLALTHLDEWTRPTSVNGLPFLNSFDKMAIRHEPYGVCCNISPWNFPLLLCLQPLVSAIAAGNCYLLKPSEIAPHTAIALTALIPKYMDTNAIQVVNGGIAETTKLLQQKFDHIFYTGNGQVAKIVMAAAAKHLTPVVLELGGKSPVYIDPAFDVKVAAKRIFWAKSQNSGQICVAPDYIMLHKDSLDAFVEGLKLAQKEMYGDEVGMKESDEYCKIINENHFNRLEKVVADQLKANPSSKVVMGGFDMADKKSLFIPTTVITGVGKNDPIMKDEIFGALLPIMVIGSAAEAIDYINDHDHPLAMYVFSADKSLQNRFLDETNSGIAMVNDLLMNMAVQTLPFGGVGGSGMGSYHGKHGFDAYTHKRATMIRPAGMEVLNEMRYPPMTASKWKIISTLLSAKIPEHDTSAMVKAMSGVFTVKNAVIMSLMGISLFVGTKIKSSL